MTILIKITTKTYLSNFVSKNDLLRKTFD